MALAVTDVVANALTDVTGAGATRTVQLPTTSVEEGDMMVICMAINKASADIGDVLTTPGGWTKAGTQILPNTASTPRMYVFWRSVPGGGLGATVDITSSDTAIGHIAVAFAIQTVDTTALDVWATPSTGTSTTLSCPAATAINTGGLIIRFGCSDDDDQASQPAMSAHTAINWEEHASPTNGESVYCYVAVQPSTTVAAATITIGNEQWGGITFVVAEDAGIKITDVETDEDFDDKDTAITLTGEVFEATQGTGKVELASESDYAAATKINQTVTSWADTAIDITVDLSTLTPGVLYMFVTNDSAERSAGFAVTVHRAVAFVLAASANIAASGENTTVQLTAPAGKTTGDFVAGRIQDDENPADAVNVTLDDYTEMEWCIKATADAEGQHQFRIVLSDGTVFDTYTVDPRWTIGAGGAISATLPLVFSAVADLKAQGKLDAATALAFSTVATLTATGKLDAAIALAFAITADLKAKGQLVTAAALAFSITADLKAMGKLDATAALAFTVAADLKAQGKLDAATTLVFSAVANLTATGKLDAAPSMVFSIVASLTDAGVTPGAISAAPSLVFSTVADLKARGELDAAVALAFTVAADLKAIGKLDAAAALAFSTIADLKAMGQLDSAAALTFSIVADLGGRGKLDAVTALAFSIVADLKARGKLDVAATLSFTTAGDLRATGKLDAAASIIFSIVADIIDATFAAIGLPGKTEIGIETLALLGMEPAAEITVAREEEKGIESGAETGTDEDVETDIE